MIEKIKELIKAKCSEKSFSWYMLRGNRQGKTEFTAFP